MFRFVVEVRWSVTSTASHAVEAAKIAGKFLEHLTSLTLLPPFPGLCLTEHISITRALPSFLHSFHARLRIVAKISLKREEKTGVLVLPECMSGGCL